MKNVLFTASVASHIAAFHLPFLEWFKGEGYIVDVAANGEFSLEQCNNHFNIPNVRNPLSLEVVRGYREIKKIINQGNYTLIHCHTPVAAMLTRLAARKSRKNGTKVIYTAHGFHFFKGAPLLNWLIYFPIEWMCSFMTDVLITINAEDYNFAKKYMHAKKVYYVPGVGLDTSKYNSVQVNKKDKREEIGVPETAKLMLSVGELNVNKNHELIIKAMGLINDYDLHYCIAGEGGRLEHLERLVEEKGLSDNVHFLGYRKDIADLMNISDIFCFPSFREGLPVSLMEAMASGLPCVVTDIRGNEDLIKDGVNGVLVSPTDVTGVAEAITKLLSDEDTRQKMGQRNLVDIKNFDQSVVMEKMREIYSEVVKN